METSSGYGEAALVKAWDFLEGWMARLSAAGAERLLPEFLEEAARLRDAMPAAAAGGDPQPSR